LCAVRLAGWAPLDLLEHQSLEVSRDRAEGVRLAYVAATRARDLLVVPAVGDDPYPPEGWIAPLNDAVYPARDRRRDAEPAPGCPAFGKDTVLERPDNEAYNSSTVAPGLHRFASEEPTPGAHSVVWWDPRALDLDREGRYGIRQEELIGKDAPANVVAEQLAAYLEWRDARRNAVKQGSEPTLRVSTVTAWARAAADSAPGVAPEFSPASGDVALLELKRDPGRPAGPRFGALVHAALAVVPLDADADLAREMAALQGRVLGASPEEVDAAAAVVSAVLAHDLLNRARAAFARGACRRESPIVAKTTDGRMLEGAVDLAFEEAGRWVVVDFKTDRELEDELDVYRRQVRVYAEMVSAATGAPADAVLFRV
jgi:hypothetical protein